jgi:transcriptional regulator with XRE-family HTH domain
MRDQARSPATTYPTIVGVVIAQLRDQQGLLQEHLAQHLGVTQATFSRIENGQSSLTVEQLRLVAQRLGKNPSHILAFAEEIELRMHNQGIEVTPKRDDERLKNVLILIGTAALIAMAVAVIANAKKA